MKKIWMTLVLASLAVAAATGRAGEAAERMTACGEEALRLLATLAGSMGLWSGLMEILEKTGDLHRFGRGMRRLLRPLFPGVEDEQAWAAMGTNIAANLMGLGNAATPAGVAAARRLSMLGGSGVRALAMLLALNNSGLQWMPTTVMSLRSAAGSADPAAIWPAAMASSLAATAVAAGMMLLVNRGGARRENRRGTGDPRHGRRGADQGAVRENGRVRGVPRGG